MMRSGMCLCLVALCVLFAPSLAASNSDDAREILSRKEYRGYRVVNGEEQSFETGSGDGTREDRRIRRDSSAQRSDGGSSWNSSGSSVDGDFIQLIAWIFLGVLGVTIIVVLVRWWLDREARIKVGEVEKLEDGVSVPVPSAARSPWQHLYEQYDQAVAAKDWAQAAILRFKIYWLSEGRTDVLYEDDVRTWRDALRLVDGDDQRRGIRRQLSLIERISYAAHIPQQSEFARWKEEMDSLSDGSTREEKA